MVPAEVRPVGKPIDVVRHSPLFLRLLWPIFTALTIIDAYCAVNNVIILRKRPLTRASALKPAPYED